MKYEVHYEEQGKQKVEEVDDRDEAFARQSRLFARGQANPGLGIKVQGVYRID